MINRLVIRTRSRLTARACYSSLLDISPAAKLDATCLTVEESFITSSEQDSLMEEIQLAVERAKYCYDHWDDVSIVYCITCHSLVGYTWLQRDGEDELVDCKYKHHQEIKVFHRST